MKRNLGNTAGRCPVVLLIGLGSSIVWLIFISQEGRSSLARWMALRSDDVSPHALVLHPFFHYAGDGRVSGADRGPSLPPSTDLPAGPVVENAPNRLIKVLAVLHLGLCLAAILCAGRFLESRWGSVRFGVFFVFVTLGAAGVSLAVAAMRGSPSVVFGTGATALACLAVASTLYDDNLVMRLFSRRYLAWGGIFAVAIGLVLLERSQFPLQGVDVFLLPQLSGIALGLTFSVTLPVYDRYLLDRELRRRRAQEQHVRDIRARVDHLLDKISTDGYESLTSEEKSFLEDASKHYHPRV